MLRELLTILIIPVVLFLNIVSDAPRFYLSAAAFMFAALISGSTPVAFVILGAYLFGDAVMRATADVLNAPLIPADEDDDDTPESLTCPCCSCSLRP